MQRQPVGIDRQTIMDNAVVLSSMHVCVHVLYTHTHKPPDRDMSCREKVYHYTLSHERALKVIYKYITPKLDTIEIRNTVQQLK